MDDLETIRKRKLQEIIRRQIEAQNEERNEEKQMSEQLKILTDKILSSEANDRLNNLRVAMPDFARQVEILLFQLYQSGRIRGVLNDEQFKQILMQMSEKKEMSIKRINK